MCRFRKKDFQDFDLMPQNQNPLSGLGNVEVFNSVALSRKNIGTFFNRLSLKEWNEYKSKEKRRRTLDWFFVLNYT